MRTLTLTAGLALAALATAAPRVADDEPTETQQTTEDVEIMRRVLVKSITEALRSKAVQVRSTNAGTHWGLIDPSYELYTPQLDLTFQVPTGDVTHSRGFHVPGVGALFSIDLEVPAKQVSAVEITQVEPEPEPEVDVWAETEREVRSDTPTETADTSVPGSVDPWQAVADWNVAITYGIPSLRWELDEEAIEEAIDEILRNVARHGSRIEHLADGESVVVTLHITASASSNWITNPHLGAGVNDLSLQTFWLTSNSTTDLVSRVTVTLPRRALLDYAGKKPSVDEVRRKARVHRY